MQVITISLNCSIPSLCGNLSLHQLADLYTEPLFIYDRLPNVLLIGTYVPLFLIALLSNVLVIVTVSRYKSLRNVTTIFLVNLSVSDLLITLICMPMAVGQAIYALWIYGDVMCKLTHYLKGVSVSASVFTITAMSLDRYMAIRHPMSRKIINRSTTKTIIFVIWILAITIFSPILYVRRSEGWKFEWDAREHLHCIEVWPDQLSQRTFGIFCFVVVYLIPGIIVVLAYSLMGLRLCSRQLLPEYEITHEPVRNGNGGRGERRQSCSTNSAWQVSAVGGRLIRERRRVAKILLILALIFAVCWLPYSVLSLILDINAKGGGEPPAPDYEPSGNMGSGEHATGDSDEEVLAYIGNLLLPFAILLGHSQAAVNPLVYCFLSKNFRRSLTELIRHPTRAIRGKQTCKIRMTFRKDPIPSAEGGGAAGNNSSEKPVSSRPRNHHAPDPPQPPPVVQSLLEPPQNAASASGVTGEICLLTEGRGLGLGIMKHQRQIAATHHSPSSPSATTTSGYVSRRSTSSESSFHSNCPQCEVISAPILFTKKGVMYCPCPDENAGRRVEVPSTIREESENSCSFHSLRSKTSNKSYSKVCFA